MLAKVRIPDPERRARSYPFELSGGMCQRVMIAMALACEPQLLIADEPTTGLDITTQAVIMDLIAELAASHRMATLLITHDLGLAAEYSDRIAVMHAGQVVEAAPAAALFAAPHHPYTAGLIAATPAARRASTCSPRSLARYPTCAARICRPAVTPSAVTTLLPTVSTIRCPGGLEEMAGWSPAIFRYDTGTALLAVDGLRKLYPIASSESGSVARRRPSCMRWTASASRSDAARLSGLSANPVAGNPLSFG